ncbi:MAG: hypothetical protein INR73_03080 [Williamsia sp.]|nr:hypothetical protein [Williamsia sp.]
MPDDEKDDKRYPAAAAEKPAKKNPAKSAKTVKAKVTGKDPANDGKRDKRYPAAAAEKPVKKVAKRK